MLTTDEFEDTYKALAVCLAARIPVILWGPPGQGKTSVIRAIAEEQGRHMALAQFARATNGVVAIG